ncbi:SDR family oxidoreductase [Actinoplanes xinjiangensis]|uniref:NAD(P)-dependent dehydrogenase (Short-subunit alcohol dehydrogenase family) n=1 Tax=Actinoplanes xinjiangensis TaxID=512350 RepID=A0A316F2Q1_9ACTN|nr:SDR family oxidoreductase [Actinoplanes xinjiangensis]PWK39483.1 NAD(P)-dependent dehydrogenase (short-subunit alcohol dehydrogenase family) [Actinoplanes xinjiangensis]GIF42653.1 oxidoreductase [Actinoplanes xinjiangensis]
MTQPYTGYDRVAVVTGSDSGIGEAIAITLAEAGFDVGVTYRSDRAGAESTAEKVRAAGRRCDVRALDLTDLPRAARRMLAAGRGGRIINITSVHEHAPRVGSGAYCAAKGGLGLLTKVMAQELAAAGITVNAVAPGEIATAMTGNEDVDPHTVARPGIPVGRPGHADEVAAVVAMLAGPAAAYVTGASYVVDGGMLLMGPQAGSHLPSGEWRDG